ncbi:MAG: hypothetical protein II822_10245 [Prevotella sp.]|nr:hypothetical protein [Prevotella sp.]
MDRKYFTFLLFYLLVFFPFTATAAGDEFPFEGGTTSDGITVTKPQSSSFQKLESKNSYHITGMSNTATMTFYVTVPEGKTASLQFGTEIHLSPKNKRKKIENSNITFSAKLDGTEVIHHNNSTDIATQSECINISGQGEHKVVLEVSYHANNAIFDGDINNLSIHIHRFSKTELTAEPLCNTSITNTSKCEVCGKYISVTVSAKSKKHKMIVTQSKKASCMGTARIDSVCEYCPKKSICLTGQPKDHQFDQSGTCSVCGLHRPTSNADNTVFTVNNAGELRVLSEMMALGRVSGNIGIDIQSDLEFNDSLTMQPLGTFDHPFQGVINGHGHRIRGVVDFYQGTDCLGIVGVAKGTLLSHAVIANLIFDSSNTMCGEACVGGIAGYAEYCDIMNCANFATLEGSDYVGGIVGYAGQQVSIVNCATVSKLTTAGKWNPTACGMPFGHILNTYAAAVNERGGTLDELPTTTLRHCFATQGSGDGLTIINENLLAAYDMVELLNEESDQTSFEMSERDQCPIPVVNSTVTAQSNRAIPTSHSPMWRRAASAEPGDDGNGDGGDDDDDSGKQTEVVAMSGYVNDSSPVQYFKTVDEVMREDSLQYPDFERTYIISRTVPEDAKLYEPISGGRITAFESYLIPADTTYISFKEYDIIAADTVMALTETVIYNTGSKDRIDEYDVAEGAYTLKSRITFENEYDIVCQENVGGLLKRVWSIETEYDTLGVATVTNCYTHDYLTGQSHLEYSKTYSGVGDDDDEAGGTYQEYQEGDTIHVTYTYQDTDGDQGTYRSHYIIRASDEAILEMRTEKVADGEAYTTEGMYFVYDDEGNLIQSVVYGPVDDSQLGGEMRPYMYHDYTGSWQTTLFPTAIEIPTMKQPTVQQRIDYHVYDLRGRVMRTATDAKDPFSGLPSGLYIYQGKKYIKR